jgi:hypothetical protein
MDSGAWHALPSARVSSWQSVQNLNRRKTALNVIAETQAFLDVNVVVECPNGEEVVTIARLDTAANTDVVAPKFFWKACLSIKQPLTAHGPIHPQVSSRHDRP